MERTLSTLELVFALSFVVITAQSAGKPESDPSRLATVRITTAVLANGASLSPGTYDVRLTQERPAPGPGQTREARQWVEFVAKGKVVGREVAEVLRDNDL